MTLLRRWSPLLIAAVLLALPTPAEAAYTVIATGIQYTANGNAESVTINATGADVIYVTLTSYVGFNGPTVADNIGGNPNAACYVEKASSIDSFGGGSGGVKLYECRNPSVSATMTITCTNSGRYPTCGVLALSGSTVSEPFDLSATATTGGVSSAALSTGSVTPTSGEIGITAIGLNSGSATNLTCTTSGWTTVSKGGSVSTGAFAYNVSPGTSAVNPAWTWTTNDLGGGITATAQSTGGSPPAATPCTRALLGVGKCDE